MHVQGKLYIYAGTQRACGACLCRGGGSAAAAGTLPWGSPCALDMTAAICLLSSSLSWLRSASMPAGIALGKGLPAPPAPPPAAAAAASPSGSPSPSKLASLPMARGHAEPPRSLQAPSPPAAGGPRSHPRSRVRSGVCRQRRSPALGTGRRYPERQAGSVALAGDARGRCLLHVGHRRATFAEDNSPPPPPPRRPAPGRSRCEPRQPRAVGPAPAPRPLAVRMPAAEQVMSGPTPIPPASLSIFPRSQHRFKGARREHP